MNKGIVLLIFVFFISSGDALQQYQQVYKSGVIRVRRQTSPENCSGGKVWRGGRCQCSYNTSWNEETQLCTQSCPNGKIRRRGRCICPLSKIWDSELGLCSDPPACTAGMVWRSRSCRCPHLSSLDPETQVCTCIYGTYQALDGTCRTLM
ncbi:unnamed protein product [Meganyctiphanes norvegica]|uniref:Uncharacterized protein n=1 Tax=Meganyctiphanes norvegica TaxID=48144 RepID=A0AAV2R1W6_MEGNR